MEANLVVYIYFAFGDPIIKRGGGLRSNYQEGWGVDIQLSRGVEMRSNYQEGEGLRSNYQEGWGVEIPFNGLTPQRRGLLCVYLRSQVTVRFVDIGGIVEHHYWNFLFILINI